MIVSRKNRYVYLQLPMTGCTAVGRELVENYDGEEVGRKHSRLAEFLKSANQDEREYFVFGNVRNPFDRIVSHFEKFRSDHDGYLTGGHQSYTSAPILNYQLKRYRYIQQSGATFSNYFRKFYKAIDPKLPPPILPLDRAAKLLRFESLASDFHEAIEAVGLEPVRTLPVRNVTTKESADYEQYYDAGCRKLAVAALGPWARHWGYDVPFGLSVPAYSQAIFDLKMKVRALI